MLYQLSYVGPGTTTIGVATPGGQWRIRTTEAHAPGLQPGPIVHSGNCPLHVTLRDHRGHGGADDGTRTRNLLFTKQLLCQLSYVGTHDPVNSPRHPKV